MSRGRRGRVAPHTGISTHAQYGALLASAGLAPYHERLSTLDMQATQALDAVERPHGTRCRASGLVAAIPTVRAGASTSPGATACAARASLGRRQHAGQHAGKRGCEKLASGSEFARARRVVGLYPLSPRNAPKRDPRALVGDEHIAQSQRLRRESYNGIGVTEAAALDRKPPHTRAPLADVPR